MSRTRAIVPIADIGSRPPQAGRIRLGIKSGKAMKSINEFRFTSPHRDVIEQIAALYGGTVKPWHDDKASPQDQWEVLSNANEINVMLSPEGLDMSYELWSGGGRQRNCDGVTVGVPTKTGPSDYDIVDQPCICATKGFRECDPMTRLSVVLPEISFRGVWMLQTKSWNAQAELPGMFDLIVMMAQQGRLVQARMSIQQEQRMTPTGKRNFIVPKLSMAQSPIEALATPGGAMPAISAPAPLALAPAVEAELIDDELLALENDLRADARNFGLDPEQYLNAVRDSSKEDRKRMALCSAMVRAGDLVPLGFLPAGGINWTKG